MNILITSASRKVSLVQAFQRALMTAGGGKVIAIDTSPRAAALYFADEHYLAPPSSEPGFLEHVLELCREQDVKLVVPTRDEELPLFAQHKERFAEAGTRLLVAEPQVIEICQDKKLFVGFCRDNGFSIPETYETLALPINSKLPLFLKPRRGKGGQQTVRVSSAAEFDLAVTAMPEAIIQEFVDAPEYTIDLFADFQGQVISVVPRERIYVFGGESFITKTVKNPVLIEEAVRLASLLGLVGHNTIQCFYSEGVVKFIEVNPRYGGAAHLGFAAGADTPLYLVELLNGRPLEPKLGEFKDDYIMLRYTQDMFLEAESLSGKRLS